MLVSLKSSLNPHIIIIFIPSTMLLIFVVIFVYLVNDIIYFIDGL